jgi:hypothetical protein
MLNTKNRDSMSTAAGLLVLLILGTIKGGLVVGLWFLTCGVIGWVNAFGAFQSIVWCLRGHKLPVAAGIIAAASVLASALVVFAGHGSVLFLTTASFLLINAIILRFNTVPIGVRASES